MCPAPVHLGEASWLRGHRFYTQVLCPVCSSDPQDAVVHEPSRPGSRPPVHICGSDLPGPHRGRTKVKTVQRWWGDPPWSNYLQFRNSHDRGETERLYWVCGPDRRLVEEVIDLSSPGSEPTRMSVSG